MHYLSTTVYLWRRGCASFVSSLCFPLTTGHRLQPDIIHTLLCYITCFCVHFRNLYLKVNSNLYKSKGQTKPSTYSMRQNRIVTCFFLPMYIHVYLRNLLYTIYTTMCNSDYLQYVHYTGMTLGKIIIRSAHAYNSWNLWHNVNHCLPLTIFLSCLLSCKQTSLRPCAQ